MIRADAINLYVDPVVTKVIGTQHILILHVCDSDESWSKWIPVNAILLQVYSTDKSVSESVIVDESSTEESKSESIHKSINTNK